ncbi:hypothetical protein DS2_15894 [Catenovulum agarivorans DS-2]|uniref:Lipoprotein n=1 Tax=Catenovulum agarivorans DS-2 TaxID=1328313 RepID=W7Q9S8_9ALTE|nr:hypothetical protein [Catenovulum agarivorans]EWH08731.1 hypothetical protein DS2_15894 [Catenovulum agarivorans DS-2]
MTKGLISTIAASLIALITSGCGSDTSIETETPANTQRSSQQLALKNIEDAALANVDKQTMQQTFSLFEQQITLRSLHQLVYSAANIAVKQQADKLITADNNTQANDYLTDQRNTASQTELPFNTANDWWSIPPSEVTGIELQCAFKNLHSSFQYDYGVWGSSQTEDIDLTVCEQNQTLPKLNLDVALACDNYGTVQIKGQWDLSAPYNNKLEYVINNCSADIQASGGLRLAKETTQQLALTSLSTILDIKSLSLITDTQDISIVGQYALGNHSEHNQTVITDNNSQIATSFDLSWEYEDQYTTAVPTWISYKSKKVFASGWINPHNSKYQLKVSNLYPNQIKSDDSASIELIGQNSVKLDFRPIGCSSEAIRQFQTTDTGQDEFWQALGYTKETDTSSYYWRTTDGSRLVQTTDLVQPTDCNTAPTGDNAKAIVFWPKSAGDTDYSNPVYFDSLADFLNDDDN